MKRTMQLFTVASGFFGSMAPLSAQNLASIPSPPESRIPSPPEFSLAIADSDVSERPHFTNREFFPDAYGLPPVTPVSGNANHAGAVFASRDAAMLASTMDTSRNVEAGVDLDLHYPASPYRKMSVSTQGQPYRVSSGNLQTGLARVSAVYREAGEAGTNPDCSTIALSVAQRIKLDSSKVLEIVETEIGANPSCACEIVKAAIISSDASSSQVAAIVETAINADPESMRIVSQCAIAANPDSIAEVQALLTRLDPNAGESGDSSKGAKSAKSAKSAKQAFVASIVSPYLPNPLDLPPSDPPLPPPPPISPPPVTEVDPRVQTF